MSTTHTDARNYSTVSAPTNVNAPTTSPAISTGGAPANSGTTVAGANPYGYASPIASTGNSAVNYQQLATFLQSMFSGMMPMMQQNASTVFSYA